MKLNVTLKNLDYESLITLINESVGHIFGLLGLENVNGIAVKAINGSGSFLIGKIHSLCEKHDINIRLNGINADLLDSDTIKLSIDADEIDYLSVVRQLLPVLQKSLEKNDRLYYLAEALEKYPEAFTSSVSSFLYNINGEEMEKLIVSSINAFEAEIIDALQKAASAKNLRVTVVSLSAGSKFSNAFGLYRY